MLWLWLILPLASATFSDQSAGAKGYVSCRGVRQPGVFVQLYDEDSIFPFDSDDLMGSTTADGLGHFCVKGTTSEVTEIEPYILIEHNCGYEGLDQKTEFFYYLDKEFITEGNITMKVQNLGEIELLTAEAPVQDYKKKHYHHKHLAHSQREKIDQCIPLYVTYKDFFEKEVFGTGTESVKVLETDDDGFQPAPPPVQTDDSHIQTELEEVVKIHEEIKDIEKQEQENLRKLEEETRRLEDERIRLEEERKREEELKRQEEERLRLQEEENRRLAEEERRKDEERRREEDRRKAEEERLREEERRKQEYEKAMEDYRRREEERRLEIQRREEESRREKVTAVSFTDDMEDDDPCYRRIKRGAPKFDPSDPCYRRLKG